MRVRVCQSRLMHNGIHNRHYTLFVFIATMCGPIPLVRRIHTRWKPIWALFETQQGSKRQNKYIVHTKSSHYHHSPFDNQIFHLISLTCWHKDRCSFKCFSYDATALVRPQPYAFESLFGPCSPSMNRRRFSLQRIFWRRHNLHYELP